MNCTKCKKAKKLTGNKKARCLKHGLKLMAKHLDITFEPLKDSEFRFHVRVKK